MLPHLGKAKMYLKDQNQNLLNKYNTKLFYFGINIGMMDGLRLEKEKSLLKVAPRKTVSQLEIEHYCMILSMLLMQFYFMLVQL